MRSFFVFSVLLMQVACTQFSQNQVEAETITSIILMRHAEKELIEDPNPPLTNEGIFRAEKVAQVFEAVSIDAIYSSPYIRTQKTAEPLAISKNLTIQSYNPAELFAFAQQVKVKHAGQTIFISGHSNTTPALINELTGTKDLTALDETEYDWIYILDLSSGGNYSVKKLKITL